MTQAEIKRSPSPSLKGIDQRDSLSDAHVAERANGVKAVQPVQALLPPANDANLIEESSGADPFVFEEASAPVVASTPRESIVVQTSNDRSAPHVAAAPSTKTPSENTVHVLPLPAPSASTPKEAPAAASRPAKQTSASAPVSEPSAAASDSEAPAASGRNDFELRAKLNQKQSEILSLRNELSARDRQVLELKEKQLELERSYLQLNETLEHQVQLLTEAKNELRAHEAEKEAAAKRLSELTSAFRRREENAKRKSERELENVRAELSSELEKHVAAHASALEQRERSQAAELERLRSAHATAMEEAQEKHSTALRNLETASSQALAKAASVYAAKVRSLEELHKDALAKAAASHAATLEAQATAAASDKARALTEAESTHRATQSELTSALSTVQFLERTQAGQAARITRQDARIAELEESLSRATTRADAAEETLTALRRALSAGLSLLNASSRPPEGV